MKRSEFRQISSTRAAEAADDEARAEAKDTGPPGMPLLALPPGTAAAVLTASAKAVSTFDHQKFISSRMGFNAT